MKLNARVVSKKFISSLRERAIGELFDQRALVAPKEKSFEA